MRRAAPPQPHQLHSGEESERRDADQRGFAQQHVGLVSAQREAGCPTAGAGAGAQRRRLEQETAPTPAAVAAGRGAAEREVQEARQRGQQREERRGGLHGERV